MNQESNEKSKGATRAFAMKGSEQVYLYIYLFVINYGSVMN